MWGEGGGGEGGESAVKGGSVLLYIHFHLFFIHMSITRIYTCKKSCSSGQPSCVAKT